MPPQAPQPLACPRISQVLEQERPSLVCLLLGLCSAPRPGAVTHNPIADLLHLKPFWA